jgi:predicted phosphodiesterase
MVTHDCPETVADHLFGLTGKLNIPSRTRQAFDSMWEAHKPEIWIFGHWHQSRDQNIMGTRFVCLAELEAKEIEI